MSDSSFNETDKRWQKALEKEREKMPSPELMKNFSSQVVEKIEKREEKRVFKLPEIVSARVFVPVFTMMILASFVVLRLPFESPKSPAIMESIQIGTANASEVEEDIAELRELGAWTEEDEQSTGISSGFEALEIGNDSA